MRWPTEAISALFDKTFVSPAVSSVSRRSVAFARDSTGNFSFLVIPAAVRAVRRASSPCHSIFPSHSGTCGDSGREEPNSYKKDFWLLEPELRTRIFTQ